MMMRTHLPAGLLLASALLGGLGGLGGCSGSGSTEDDTVTVAGEVPIVYVKRPNTVTLNPVNGAPGGAGGDLMLREKSSPSAPEHNLTERFTQGKGDASDPEVSYDGKKVLFALRCPASNTATVDGQPACTGRWNIWEYDMSEGGLTGGSFRRLTASTSDDDVDPAYLPGGRGVVFSSNRQTQSKTSQALGRSYYALDEYERERVYNLHTMDAQGGAITQISFNQSHDRNPVVRPNGDVMFSRWDHQGGRNHFKVFRIKPDGTDLFVLYGAHSEGNSFLHPRDMDPAGAFPGQVVSDLMPLSGTREGGGLVLVDMANYSEQNTPANTTVPTQGGQRQLTAQALNLSKGLSLYGRITTPYPLWDGSDRILLAWQPCEVSRDGVTTACANLSQAELDRLGDSTRLRTQVNNDPIQDNLPPRYALYMFDPAKQTWLNVASPPQGFFYTDPVALVARAEPNATDPTPVDATLAAQGLGLIEVRSVYDTDGLGRMSDPMLVDADLPPGCSSAIPKTTPLDPLDTRAQVADLLKMKDPAQPAYLCSPARFVRAIRAVAPPSGSTGLRKAIGQTDFEPQQILGYAPIEPDGSFKLHVPADVPVAVAVIDAQGRAFQTHTNWIQVRPGERRTCDGCHSPRRGGALNSGVVVNTLSSALRASLAGAHQSGETMASTRTRLDPTALKVTTDLLFTDHWADTAQAGVSARPDISLRYSGNPLPEDDLATPVPSDGLINYPEHIQPLWGRDRGDNTCTHCHDASTRLDLSAGLSGTGRMVSYERLLVGTPAIDAATGLPKITVMNGVQVIARNPALVNTGASEGDATGLARKSRLMEILSGELLKADGTVRALYPMPAASAPDHAGLLNRAEKRLLAEWLDLGAKYYNDPFHPDSGVREITPLSETVFASDVFPVLRSTCANGCHQALGSEAGSHFADNRLVLTGDTEGDYNVSLTMVADVCAPDSSYLLARPASVPHPADVASQVEPVLPASSPEYAAIRAWISSGCTTPASAVSPTARSGRRTR